MNSRIPLRPLTETDVAEAVDGFLREKGHSLSRQFRIRTWRPDLVAVKDNHIVIVEAKGQFGDLRKAVARTALYATDGAAAYLALPTDRVTETLKDSARTLGIGLIEVREKARVSVTAPIGRPRPAL